MTEITLTAIDWPATLVGEALACGLISKALYDYPDSAWLQTLIDEDVFAVAPFAETQPETVAGLTLLQGWSAAHRGGLSQTALNDLRADYTRLFIGTGTPKAALWESVYFNEDRLLFQEQTAQVRRWYRQFGLEVQRLNQEPDDHLGLELAFLAHLAQIGLAALEQGQEATLDQLLAAQREFLAAHPLRWVATWYDQVQQHARTDFYRGIARLTVGVLTELAATFDLQLAPVLNS